MTYVPIVDPLACSAHGDCAVIAPGVFEISDVAAVVATADVDVLLAAAEACPAAAISVVDDATGEQLYP